jgi:hypothetical protein
VESNAIKRLMIQLNLKSEVPAKPENARQTYLVQYAAWAFFCLAYMASGWPGGLLLSDFSDSLHAKNVAIDDLLTIVYSILAIWYLVPIGLAIALPWVLPLLRIRWLLPIYFIAYILVLYIPAQAGVDFVGVMRTVSSALSWSSQ